MLPFPALVVVVVFAMGFLTGRNLACAAQRAGVDLSTYAADQLACIEREPSDACHADKAACKARMDRCREDVRARYEAGAP